MKSVPPQMLCGFLLSGSRATGSGYSGPAIGIITSVISRILREDELAAASQLVYMSRYCFCAACVALAFAFAAS